MTRRFPIKANGRQTKPRMSAVAKWVASRGAMGAMWHFGLMREPELSAQIDHVIDTLATRARISRVAARDCCGLAVPLS
jgi:hypothetical protein